ncbi:MAG: hypothetical protein ABIG84_00035 [archaeon]
MLIKSDDGKKRKAVFIGAGNVGSSLRKKVYQNSDRLGLEPYATIRRSGASYCIDDSSTTWNSVLNELNTGNVVFIATPSDGSAIPYIEEALNKGIYVVSCEKAAAASKYPMLAPHIDILYKDNANVGGDTGLKPATKELINTQGLFAGYDRIVYILNGTMGHILKRIPEIKKEIYDSLQEAEEKDIIAETIKTAFQEVCDLGYAEPGKESPLEILEEEIYGDIIRKAAIMTNHIEHHISPFNIPNNSPQDIRHMENVNPQSILDYIAKLTDKNTKLVTVIKQINGQDLTDYKIAEYIRNEFAVEIGFMENTSGDLAMIEGVLNGAVIGRNGTYINIVEPKPGAGAEATSYRMLKDYSELISKEKTIIETYIVRPEERVHQSA